MKRVLIIFCGMLLVTGVFAEEVPSAPVSQATNIVWDSKTKTMAARSGEPEAHLVFNLTNETATAITILGVHTSCGCTTAQLPPLPWVVVPGTNGQIGVTVDINGKSGLLSKTVTVDTDKGSDTLMVEITILPPEHMPALPADERAQNMKTAAADRQAVFQGTCANCHLNPTKDKYGHELYETACAICHESKHRATMVADLHAISTPTNREFWRNWIAYGRPHSLMPAFATAEGGPLSDAQIASLADYLITAIPSK